MAFTSEGMFYLSEEDLAPTVGLVGKGLRGMFGMPNKEEAVESVLRRTNPDDPASREAALREIASIDPDAYSRVAGIFNELDKAKLASEETKLDIEIKRDKLNLQQASPRLEKAYKNTQMTADIINWMKMNTTGIDEEDIGSIITSGNAQDLLFKAYKGKSGAKWKELQTHLKEKMEAYVNANYKEAKGSSTTSATTKVDDSVFSPRVVPNNTTTPTDNRLNNTEDYIGGA